VDVHFQQAVPLAQHLWRTARCHVSSSMLEKKSTAGEATVWLRGFAGLNFALSSRWRRELGVSQRSSVQLLRSRARLGLSRGSVWTERWGTTAVQCDDLWEDDDVFCAFL